MVSYGRIQINIGSVSRWGRSINGMTLWSATAGFRLILVQSSMFRGFPLEMKNKNVVM